MPDIIGMHFGPPLVVHPLAECIGQICCIHNPSEHAMRAFPQNWCVDRGLMERVCPHGIGHPDPDDLAYKRRSRGPMYSDWEGVHGCDGCCVGSYGGA